MIYAFLSILTLVIAFFYNKKVVEQKRIVKLKIQEKVLAEQQKEIEAQLATLDAGIKKAQKLQKDKERKRLEDSLTLKQRADRIKKGIKK